MELPSGIIKQSSEHEGRVCKLKRALYGLKQSPRAWFGRFTLAMKTTGYRQSIADHTLFVKHKNGKVTTLIVYVDDMILTDDDSEKMRKSNIVVFLYMSCSGEWLRLLFKVLFTRKCIKIIFF
jgi:hypothetical protein